MNTQMVTALLIGVLALTVAGCSHYYRVTEPTSGRTYYTTDIDERSGTVKFKDDRTKSTVILHSAEVSELSEAEYGAEVMGMRPVTLSPPVASKPSASMEPY